MDQVQSPVVRQNLFLTRNYKFYIPQFFFSYLINNSFKVVKLKPYVLSFAICSSCSRQSNASESIKYHYQRLFSIFLTKPKKLTKLQPFWKPHFCFDIKLPKKTRHLCKRAPFQYFREYWKNGKWPVVLSLFCVKETSPSLSKMGTNMT